MRFPGNILVTYSLIREASLILTTIAQFLLSPLVTGKTCKNLLAPENGDIEYVVEEYERDDLSILQVRDLLTFAVRKQSRLFP